MPSNRYAIFKGEIVPIEDAKLSIMAHVVNYGTGCFGGIRAYWNEGDEQLYIFRGLDHYKRLLDSAKLLLMNFNYTKESLLNQLVELLRLENFKQDVYVRALVYKMDEVIGVRLNNLSDAYSCFAIPFGRYVDKEEGLRVGVSSWRRVNDNVIPPRGKIIGSYANSAFAKSEALLNGFDEAIVLTEKGHVAEGSAENIFIYRHGKLITPPISDSILEGITRSTIMTLAKEVLGIEVVERSIDRSELYIADEVFLCGTGCQIASVIEVDKRPVGSGSMGELVKSFRDLYFKIVRGEYANYKEQWCTPVF